MVNEIIVPEIFLGKSHAISRYTNIIEWDKNNDNKTAMLSIYRVGMHPFFNDIPSNLQS